MTLFKRSMTLGLAVCLAGCAGSSNTATNFPTSGGPTGVGPKQIIIRDDGQPTLPSGDTADSVEVEAFDAAGNRIYGPVVQPLAPQMVFGNVPDTTPSRIEVDYLRNGGFLLLRANIVPATGQVTFTNIDEQPVDPNTTAWQVTRDANGNFQFVNTVAGAQVAVSAKDIRAKSGVPFDIKGVCYSPAAIGASNKFGSLGDYFWKGGFDVGGGQILQDWEKVWRRDLDKIRPNFNAIRLYSLIAMQQNSDGTLPNPVGYRDFTHERFLDACWNNGNQPIYVLVGIPMSSLCYVPGTNPNAAAEQAWWEENLRRTVQQVGKYPAVLGFTIFNEIGGATEWGGNPTTSEFYWSQVQKYSGIVKQLAPDKLCGFAYFDAPGNASTAIAQGLPQKYGTNLDFFGVNAFQSETIEPTLAPYAQLDKPVLFTEFGLPATTHSDPSTFGPPDFFPTQSGSLSISENSSTRQKTGDALNFILPKVLAHPKVAGTFYFEWSDEWWKQDPVAGKFDTQATRWDGGKKTGAPFPNEFNDEEGYGLHSIALNGRAANQPFSVFSSTAPAGNTRPDILTRRQELWNAVTTAFGAVR